jgi:Glycosyltransferase family 9 (heptosyltransferase)
MKDLHLTNFQSPGDIVMLTAAARDLQLRHPGKFAVTVHTSAGELWERNPHATFSEAPPIGAEVIKCDYPLIHRSNQEPWHFIHGFHQHLGSKLGVKLEPTAFKGDIHLSDGERGWMSQVQEFTKERVPYWIVAAGGKFDYTAKWWPQERYQEVVDHFAGRILFVQVGEADYHHPALRGVLDLRGKTDLRQLVRLMHHAQGVVCPVTLLMHLAVAVPTAKNMCPSRPCVVIAGGREPSQWEAYPSHQFLHTCGALHCCDRGGCWKSRVVPLGDKDSKNNPEEMCVDVVHLRNPELSFKRRVEEEVPAHARADNPARIHTDYLLTKWEELVHHDQAREAKVYTFDRFKNWKAEKEVRPNGEVTTRELLLEEDVTARARESKRTWSSRSQ